MIKPKLIAHRGAKREAPENTIPAFRRALELGCDGIEFDVVLTKDRVPIVTHDNDLSILTPNEGFVHKTTFSIIKSLDFGSHFRLSFSHITVPTLTEVFELLQPHDISIICEIKPQPGLAFHVAQLVGGIVSDFRFRQPITISSRSPKILYHLKKLTPNLRRAIIVRNKPFSFLRSNIYDKYLDVAEYHVYYPLLKKSRVKKLQEQGKKVSAWTVNKEEDFKRCIELEVDSIITDDIGFAKKYLNS
ncbi:MAG: glycerophosphodiester phosphodiesterase [Pseudomonadota bacterium]